MLNIPFLDTTFFCPFSCSVLIIVDDADVAPFIFGKKYTVFVLALSDVSEA